ALVRPQITCGTHALAIALSACVRPGEEIFSPVGLPYDTLQEVIGIRKSPGSLSEWGVSYSQAELLPDGGFDWDAIRSAIHENTKLATIQRSRGYASRPTFSVAQIGELIQFIKKIKPDIICMVDNCYGEFTETMEPSEAGADLVVGSLIKNPGGGLSPVGGYIAGKKELVAKAAYRLTAPGLGKEVGASLGVLPSFYQGFFLAPEVVANALKSAVFAAAVFEELGFEVLPKPLDSRSDIVQEIIFRSPEKLLAFCRAIQACSPIDASFAPEPWPMPGYGCDVVMAAGTFVSGSSIELSADGPMREPYSAYFQGGLTFHHAKAAILRAAQEILQPNT
ncbi:MAG: methionine gamma-lyase family protein, partial [Lachnospiraceae bacterium]|nr:methionine gamma-lyase family protein [Lachnospiraceae bacterium]